MAAFQGMHVLPAKQSYMYVRLPRKCDYWTDSRQIERRRDRQTPDKVIHTYCYASQVT